MSILSAPRQPPGNTAGLPASSSIPQTIKSSRQASRPSQQTAQLRKLLQRKRLPPDRGRQSHALQRLTCPLLGNSQLLPICKTVGKRLPALVKGSPDDSKQLSFILRMHRRRLISVHADNGTAHIGPGNKAVRRHIRHDFRPGIILHRKGKGAVILAPRPRLHPFRHFLLHHHRDTLQRHMILK